MEGAWWSFHICSNFIPTSLDLTFSPQYLFKVTEPIHCLTPCQWAFVRTTQCFMPRSVKNQQQGPMGGTTGGSHGCTFEQSFCLMPNSTSSSTFWQKHIYPDFLRNRPPFSNMPIFYAFWEVVRKLIPAFLCLFCVAHNLPCVLLSSYPTRLSAGFVCLFICFNVFLWCLQVLCSFWKPESP